MGLMIHSLTETPSNVEREYYIYLLDYGWDEPLAEAMYKNFGRMAEIASKNEAVVIRGVGEHFVDEVFSWHHVNGQPSDNILPAILITTRNPHAFRDINDHKISAKLPMILIPLRTVCKTTTEVIELIDRIFVDIREGRELSNFEIAQELRAGNDGALANAVILRPSFCGIGIDLKEIFRFLRSHVSRLGT
jgi:hypothetical protein